MKLTASLGFAITIPGENITAREMVRRADRALYDAKGMGRNKVCYYKPEQAPVVQIKAAAHKRRKAAG